MECSSKISGKIAEKKFDNSKIVKTPINRISFPSSFLGSEIGDMHITVVTTESNFLPANLPLIDLTNKLKEQLIRKTERNTLLQIRSIAQSRKRHYDIRNIGVQTNVSAIDKSTHYCSSSRLGIKSNNNELCKLRTYTDAEILSALRIRTMCRTGPYSFLIKEYPHLHLPSSDTINKRISHLKAHSGIQTEVLTYLSEWKYTLKQDCNLVLDEVSFEERIEFTTHLKQVTGIPTLSPCNNETLA